VIFFDKKPASETHWTQQLCIYDLRTNQSFTLKTRQLQRSDLDEFVKCYYPENRHERTPTWSEANPTGRWRAFPYDELGAREKPKWTFSGCATNRWKTAPTYPLGMFLRRRLQTTLKPCWSGPGGF
jgi:hypothetical protein